MMINLKPSLLAAMLSSLAVVQQVYAQAAPIGIHSNTHIVNTAGLVAVDENKLERRINRLKHGLQDLKVMLDIRPEQESAFQTFGQNMQAQVIAYRVRLADHDSLNQNMTTTERMIWQENRLATQLELMKQRHVIIKALYAVLDERQRTVFDQEYSRFVNDLRPTPNKPSAQ